MKNAYDLIVIGAGPGGLMAAKTAGERGLNVLLVDRKKEIPKIRRTCCSSFYLESNYMGETTQMEEGKLVFTRNDFTVKYSGSRWPIKEKYGLSPGFKKWHMVRFESEDYSKDTPLSVVLDKEVLIEGLLAEAQKLGVTVMNGAKGKKIENNADGIKLEICTEGHYLPIKGRKAIVADGVNSKMVERMGLNKDRKVMGAGAVFLEYVMDGVDNPFPNAVLNFHGEKITKFGPLFLWPNSKGLPRIMAMNRLPEYPKKVIDYFIKESPYASWFKQARIIEKTGGFIMPRSAILDPCIENTLIIGDAAAFIEVENQGAMMCGFRAGNAVYEELNGSDGFRGYRDWWKHSFEFNHPELLKKLAACPAFEVVGHSDEDIDYLFSLIDGEDIYGTCSQYRSGATIWNAILKHTETIKAEKPLLYEKVKAVMDLGIDDIFTV